MDTTKPIETEIEVFKSGTITDSSGSTKTWTPADLQTIVNNYNEKIAQDAGAEAPIVKGHEQKSGDPAYGWVKQLKVVGDKIKADITLVSEFASEVKQQLFKKCSIGLDENLLLKHLAFLGAVHPAVKGLEPITLSEMIKYNIYYFAETETISNEETPVITNNDIIGIDISNPNGTPTNAKAAIKFAIGKQETTDFSIALNENLKREKPAVYAEYETNDFADPTHFKFPIKTKTNVLASMAIFSKPNVFAQYPEPEQQYIASRIILAAKQFEIQLTPKVWAYAEVKIPTSLLSKKQLEDFINRNLAIDNKFVSTNNPKGNNMNDWMQGFITYITQWLNDNATPEIATEFQKKYDEYLTANPMPMATPTADTTASEPPAIPTEYAERIASLEKENRLMKHDQYFAEQSKTGQLVPAQKEKVLTALELGNTIKSFEFSEGKKVDGTKVIKDLIASFPVQINFNEVATNKNAEPKKPTVEFSAPAGSIINETALDAHGEILKYQEAMQAKGTPVSYEVAAVHIMSTINN